MFEAGPVLDPGALARRIPAGVRFGTSSWNYPGWRGLVYRERYKGRGASTRMLEEYARFPLFRTLGIDASFYAAPTPEILAGWAADRAAWEWRTAAIRLPY